MHSDVGLQLPLAGEVLAADVACETPKGLVHANNVRPESVLASEHLKYTKFS